MSTGEIEEACTLVLRSMRLHASIGALLGFGYGMHTLALCEGLLGSDERATVLGAAADRMYGDLGLPVELDAILTAHRNHQESARATLGDRRYEAAHQRGWAMTAEEAVAYAVGENAPDSPSGTSARGVLTARELEVVELVADGLSNKQIAQRLFITPRTVRGHIENVMTKLGVNTRAQIASWQAGHSA
jgi:non-specific serine/threonine protein kinase